MAGPIPSYLTTQSAAQTAFTVPFGLLSLVNTAITNATTVGQFTVTVDCSLFVVEDISNLRVYLDSLGYQVEFAKGSSNKSLLIEWQQPSNIGSGSSSPITVNQGTTPWIISGNVAATQSGSWTVSLASGSIEIGTVDQGHAGSESWLVDVTNFPAIQTVSVNNFPATQPISGTVTALQGTSPWLVSGTITTSPDVNIHDGAGNSISSTGTSLDANVTNFPNSQNVVVTNTPTVNQGTSPWVTSVSNFPATVAVTQSTSPWVVSGTVTANAGTGSFTVAQATGTNLHAVIDSGNIAASQSGIWNIGRTWVLSSGSDSVAAIQSGSWTVAGTGNFTVVQPTGTNLHTVIDSGTVTANQGTSPWVVSGTVTANAGTGNFTVVQATGTNLHTVLDSGTLTSITNALPAGTNVIGHVITDSGSTIAVTGNVTVVQPTGTNLHTVVDSGIVTANIGTTGGLALDTTLTNATQKTKLVDAGGTNVAVVDAAGELQVDVNNFPATQAVTQSGAWTVTSIPSDGTKATYSAAVVGFASASLATDIWTITGSATKTVRVTRIEVTGTTTTAAGISLNIQLIRRSAANTGGTTVTDTAVPHDSTNAAGTATVVHYTANPTALGAAVGPIRSDRDTFVAVGNDTFNAEWEFGTRPSQAIVLRGTSQILAINLGGVTINGSAIDINVEWTEE